MHAILADYQCRGQALKDVGVADIGIGLGDGWLRLLQFDLDRDNPGIQVQTYSTQHAFSTDRPDYASWYKEAEHPNYSDEEFLAEDDFVIDLSDFKGRFGVPSR